MPVERREAAGWLIEQKQQPVKLSCKAMKISRATWHRPAPDRRAKDQPIIDRLNEVITRHGRWGFWKCFHWLRQRGETWNHKRVHRVYQSMKLNLPRRARKRLPARVKQPLDVASNPGQLWSMDFMSDTPVAWQTVSDPQRL